MHRIHVHPGAVLAAVATGAIALALPVGAATAGPTARAARAAKVQLRHTSLGTVLVDSSGFTVFRFSKDGQKKNTCAGTSGCSQTWPPLTTTGTPTAGPGAKASLLSTITLHGGVKQVTYAGHPLYRYFNASERGETAYVGAKEFGGTWEAVSSSGSAIK